MSDPALRIGDSERDAAVTRLQEHHAAGRLSLEEFDDRVDRALSARTAGELGALFGDLPASGEVVPAPAPAPVAERGSSAVPERTGDQRWNWRTGLSAAAFPIALVLCFATDWRFWWIIMIPMVVNALVWGGQGGDPKDRRRRGDH